MNLSSRSLQTLDDAPRSASLWPETSKPAPFSERRERGGKRDKKKSIKIFVLSDRFFLLSLPRLIRLVDYK